MSEIQYDEEEAAISLVNLFGALPKTKKERGFFPVEKIMCVCVEDGRKMHLVKWEGDKKFCLFGFDFYFLMFFLLPFCDFCLPSMHLCSQVLVLKTARGNL